MGHLHGNNGINHLQDPPTTPIHPPVSRTDQRVDQLLRQAIHHPDFHARLHPMVSGVGRIVLDHCANASHAFISSAVCKAIHDSRKAIVWLVCDLPRHRERIAVEMELWGQNPLVLPELANIQSIESLPDPESHAERHAILREIAHAGTHIVICDSTAFDQACPAPATLESAAHSLCAGTTLDPTKFTNSLADHHYERVPIVSSRGQFALRGGIIDVFPWQAIAPLRIEFFDNEIESIREFDIDSQTSTRKLDEAEIALSEPTSDSNLAVYRRSGDIVISIDAAIENPDVLILEGAHPGDGEEDFTLATFPSPLGTFEAGDFILDEIRREQFFQQLNDWQRAKWNVAMVFANQGEQDRFEELSGKDLSRDLRILPMRGELIAGFTMPLVSLAVLSSSELFGRYRNSSIKRRSILDRVSKTTGRGATEEMSDGDLVVHYEYGIARFRGIVKNDEGEEILLEYRDGAMLGVPLEQAHLVGKYVGLGGRTPDLNKLGGAAWKSARKAAEKSILDYAAQLLRVQAERNHEPGFAQIPDTRWMWEFERSFHHTETPDQHRAIEETKRDLESPRPMDRLICGDVGFGKTEVAIRAAFKTITSGRQVAILVPTTVLAEQHWHTFRERMSDYPIRVDLLNRFRSPSEIRDTIAGVADGSVDLVIGTHRLVSGDVIFKNLGLVVIDEEQRFGVAHKEKFKQLFRQVDVLTLSATPIPRTLYMALMGARDMSTIDTPPPNRIPVATSISPYDERIIVDAIRREMKRGGQVFFLHNRVKSIENMRERIASLVPEARVVVGHGQMNKDDLEHVMRTFVKGEADVLLSTTIIETGIDIPNANTIIIDRADRFGLADLYQLRGRVGRAGEKAHAILLLPRDMVTAGNARKRIHAIKQHTALGSGFKIAMRDLEIRGAGNLLGTKQSGHISQIGFDLYCQLLKQSIERLKGRKSQPQSPSAFKADFVISTEAAWLRQEKSNSTDLLPAFLPSSWLDDTRLRLSAYRELSDAMNMKAIEALQSAWIDRFGRLPQAVSNLLEITRIKILASNHGINSVEIQGQRLMLERNGGYILVGERRFPRLEAHKPVSRLAETLALLRTM
jgi:transcription-repair coupling factor (superfamily II helicase)